MTKMNGVELVAVDVVNGGVIYGAVGLWLRRKAYQKLKRGAPYDTVYILHPEVWEEDHRAWLRDEAPYLIARVKFWYMWPNVLMKETRRRTEAVESEAVAVSMEELRRRRDSLEQVIDREKSRDEELFYREPEDVPITLLYPDVTDEQRTRYAETVRKMSPRSGEWVTVRDLTEDEKIRYGVDKH